MLSIVFWVQTLLSLAEYATNFYSKSKRRAKSLIHSVTKFVNIEHWRIWSLSEEWFCCDIFLSFNICSSNAHWRKSRLLVKITKCLFNIHWLVKLEKFRNFKASLARLFSTLFQVLPDHLQLQLIFRTTKTIHKEKVCSSNLIGVDLKVVGLLK